MRSVHVGGSSFGCSWRLCQVRKAPFVLHQRMLQQRLHFRQCNRLQKIPIRAEHNAAKQENACANERQNGISSDSVLLQALSAINESVKWIVSFAVLSVVLWQHNLRVVWWVLGSISASFICKHCVEKIIKNVVNETRPQGARKADPGMPSSHANSLSFLSIYMALDTVLLGRGTADWLCATLLVLGASLLTGLRVLFGYHTTIQVLAGFALGTLLAGGWWIIGYKVVFSLIDVTPLAGVLLYGLTGLAMLVFAFKNLKHKF